MFWLYLVILRQLFTCENYHTALVLELNYTIVFHFCHSLIKMHLFEQFTLRLYLRYLVTAAIFSVMFNMSIVMIFVNFTILDFSSYFNVTGVVSCGPLNVGVGFLSLLFFFSAVCKDVLLICVICFVYVSVCFFFLCLHAQLVCLLPLTYFTRGVCCCLL
jgi:hypothetical protein